MLYEVITPFFTTKSAERGTGMGLASVYGTVRNHKGAVNVYSELEVGTTFRLYLPQCSDDGCEMAPKEKHIPVAGTASILVVDDDRITSYNVCYTKLLRWYQSPVPRTNATSVHRVFPRDRFDNEWIDPWIS